MNAPKHFREADQKIAVGLVKAYEQIEITNHKSIQLKVVVLNGKFYCYKLHRKAHSYTIYEEQIIEQLNAPK